MKKARAKKRVSKLKTAKAYQETDFLPSLQAQHNFLALTTVTARFCNAHTRTKQLSRNGFLALTAATARFPKFAHKNRGAVNKQISCSRYSLSTIIKFAHKFKETVQRHYSCSPCRHSVNGAGLRATFAGRQGGIISNPPPPAHLYL